LELRLQCFGIVYCLLIGFRGFCTKNGFDTKKKGGCLVYNDIFVFSEGGLRSEYAEIDAGRSFQG
jgi:hypothetical protein